MAKNTKQTQDTPDQGTVAASGTPDPTPAQAETPDNAFAAERYGFLPEVNVGEAIDGMAAWEELQQELAAARDRELRAHAELENFRKRLYRQMEEDSRYAAVPLASDLLSVVDNLERAIQAADKSGSSQGLLEGVRLVVQQLQRILAQHHCERISAKGQLFDPSLHQAIGHLPSDVHPVGTVTEEAQVGYRLHDRVIRPSLVLVSAGPAASAAKRPETSPSPRAADEPTKSE